MVTIGLLPLDERPCNYRFPSLMCQGNDKIQLLVPPKEWMGQKKTPANTQALAQWLMDQARYCDALVLSLDTLVYGGIAPSRLHHLPLETCLERLEVIRRLRREVPHLKLYGFNLIMRAPAYSSSEEEPDYYAAYGRQLYLTGQGQDMAALLGDEMPTLEKAQWEEAKAAIPPEVLVDFENRRNVNHHVNLFAIELVHQGILDFLVIPLDDCAHYGWAPREQRVLRQEIISSQLGTRIHVYSGADDVGSVLVARAANQLWGKTPLVHVRTSASGGDLVIPKYEDRMFGESVKWQILTAGGLPWAIPGEADWVLMTNAPTASGEEMTEAPLALTKRHSSYNTDRCLPEFIMALKTLARQKPVALADAAMGNGADDELMNLLAAEGLLESLSAYGGWNTAANAMGTCIAQAMLRGSWEMGADAFTVMRLVEDWGYMVHVREKAVDTITRLGGDAFTLKGYAAQLGQEATQGLNHFLLQKSPALARIWRVSDVTFPWHRLFEIEFHLDQK